MGLTEPLLTVLGRGVSGRDLILLGGGLFLIFKATWEIYAKVEGDAHEPGAGGRGPPSCGCWCRSCCSTSCSRSTR